MRGKIVEQVCRKNHEKDEGRFNLCENNFLDIEIPKIKIKIQDCTK